MGMGMNQTVCYCKVMIEFINFTSLDHLFMIHFFMHMSAPMKICQVKIFATMLPSASRNFSDAHIIMWSYQY